MTNSSDVRSMVDALKALYPDALCSLPYPKDYELLFAVRLAAQCTDERVNQVMPALCKRFPTLEAFAQADPEEVGEYVHSCGFFRAKSRDIVLCAQMLLRDYGGKVPGTMEDLLKLPGVGRKTANVVMANAFGIPTIAVDTHVFRVSNRLGLAHARDVLETEKQLMQVVPREDWIAAHHWLIFHGRRVCDARRPACGRCTLAPLCEYVNKGDDP